MKLEYDQEHNLLLSHKWYLLVHYGVLIGCISAIICLIGYGIYHDSQKPIYEVNRVLTGTEITSVSEVAKLIKTSSMSGNGQNLIFKYYSDSLFNTLGSFISYNDELNNSLKLGDDVVITTKTIYNKCKQVVQRPDGTEYDMIGSYGLNEPEHKEKFNYNSDCKSYSYVLINDKALQNKDDVMVSEK